MEIQTELLQPNITIEHLPHGSDMPYRIIVQNNPINWIDPWGLAQEDINRAQKVLQRFNREYYNHRPTVSLGYTGDTKGYWDPVTGNIFLSEFLYGGDLSIGQRQDLLETLAHEYYHSLHPWRSLWDQYTDPDHKYIFDMFERDEILSQHAYDAMTCY